ncbi:MAG: hypothetical protein LBF61_02485 [Azoarcus sp.]|nr:hypothetical protein [Azoarcus sp.]
MSDDQFYLLRAELSEADFKHFSNERAKQRNPTSASGKGAGDLDSESVKRTLDSRLHMIGVNTSPGKDKSAAARLGAIRKYVDERLLVAQREAGKKFDDQEITKHIDMLLAQQAMFDGWWGDHSGTMLAMTVDDIPDKERDEISTAFRRAGIENPSDAQVLELYWQSVTHRKHGLKEGEK